VKRLHWKIFALAASATTGLALAAVILTPPGALTGPSFFKLAGLGLVASLALAWIVGRMSLVPLEQVRDLVGGLSSGRRDQRLLWSYGDERDATAIALNRTCRIGSCS